MEGFTIIDGVVAIVIVLSAILAYSRGLVRETLAVASWIAGALLASMLTPALLPTISEFVPKIPMVGDFAAGNCEINVVLTFSVILVIGLIVFSLFTPLLSSVVQRSVLGGLDQGLGFLFGVVRGIVLVVIAFFVYELVSSGSGPDWVENSRSAVVLGEAAKNLGEADSAAAYEWFETQYNSLIGGNCGQ